VKDGLFSSAKSSSNEDAIDGTAVPAVIPYFIINV
jgi:hypothetical protein